MEERNLYKVSVVVPVYGVERFVERCVESLMQQTLRDVEFIFVDDCTPDKSMEIVHGVIARYPGKEVKFLRHDRNRGLPAARNTGMSVAKGEYIYHCDSDDFLEPELLEKLYHKAIECDADMVWCDWYLSFGKNERYMSQPDASTGREALRNALTGIMKYNVWNKITRRSLFIDNGVCFPEGFSMGEDMTMIRLMACAGKTSCLPSALYHYVRTNTGAMTQSYSEKHLRALRHNVAETVDFIDKHVSDSSIGTELNLFKLCVKLPFLFTGKREDIGIWREWYTEANRYIMSNRSQSMRTRLLQLCASMGMTWVNVLYTKLVFNFFYGKIFK